jgi:DNA polymerase-3 subunit delta
MAKSPSAVVPSLKLLLSPDQYHPRGMCVIAGDDAFLRHEVRVTLIKAILGEQADQLGAEHFEGRSAEWRDVLDSLRERSLFGGDQRVVVIEDADPFVKLHREQLEGLVKHLPGGAVLILEVSSFPGNTRLAKAVAQHGLTISCSVPQQGAELTEFTKLTKEWLIARARSDHDVELKKNAADLLVDLLPLEPGIMFQEVARLAMLADKKSGIDADLVRENVGGWRVRKTWDMIDAAADGNAAEALNQLDRLLAAGEDPFALLPQMASTFRRFAAAARTYEQSEQLRRRTSLYEALQQSGMPPFKIKSAESQLKQIGRPRAKQLYHWLLAADLELKGYNSAKDRARRVLETLIVRLSKQAAPKRPVSQ